MATMACDGCNGCKSRCWQKDGKRPKLWIFLLELGGCQHFGSWPIGNRPLAAWSRVLKLCSWSSGSKAAGKTAEPDHQFWNARRLQPKHFVLGDLVMDISDQHFGSVRNASPQTLALNVISINDLGESSILKRVFFALKCLEKKVAQKTAGALKVGVLTKNGVGRASPTNHSFRWSLVETTGQVPPPSPRDSHSARMLTGAMLGQSVHLKISGDVTSNNCFIFHFTWKQAQL